MGKTADQDTQRVREEAAVTSREAGVAEERITVEGETTEMMATVSMMIEGVIEITEKGADLERGDER